MIQFIIISVFVIASISLIIYEMHHAPMQPENYEEDLDNFCPRHVSQPEIKKGEMYLAYTRSGSSEAFIIKNIIGERVYILDSDGVIEMMDLLWLQKQITNGKIEKYSYN